MPKSITHLTVSQLGYSWPNGQMLFSNLNYSISAHRTALVGVNGVGKSTLCRILAGELDATLGEVFRQGRVCYFKQHEVAETQVNLMEYLTGVWEALSNIQNHIILDEVQKLDYEQRISDLSGGEWMRVRLLKEFFNPKDILILDEPSNHLDSNGRDFLDEFLRDYSGQVILVSHDRHLLRKVESIIELTSLGLQSYSGDYRDYLDQRQSQRESLEDDIDRLKRDKKKNERVSGDKLRSQEKRMKRGQRQNEKGGIPRILAGSLKRQAEKTMANTHNINERIQKETVEKLQQKIREQEIAPDFVFKGLKTNFPEGKLVFEFKDYNIHWDKEPLWSSGFELFMKGPRRWALRGENGSGKTSLIRALRGGIQAHTSGVCHLGEVKLRLLDQQQSVLTPGKNLLDLMREWWQLDETEARNALALHQFTGDKAFLKSEELSGGERVKAALLSIFFKPQDFIFLILDEPTNNLDLKSIELVERVLLEYRGPMLVISHDEDFLQNLNLESEITLPTRYK